MSTALWLVLIMRWMPKSYAYDRHLNDCAALEVIYGPFNGAAPLKVAHVLKLKSLPDFHPEVTAHQEVVRDDNRFRYLSWEPAPHELGIPEGYSEPLSLKTTAELMDERRRWFEETVSCPTCAGHGRVATEGKPHD